eukprot:TRINITY_DN10377_c0_g1_i1.p1 TRINITY_DN10377_c0_g1~~TRINITY_DN10377_c0_g1_i1.p1  ORF type:complete len:222 (-),score=35.48 TRINITY_DN10377_c0_g1_i1:414-1079(-)
MAAPKVTFTYFNLHGRGETIRFILRMGKVAHEEKRLTFPEWPAVKPTTKYGQLPMLTWDGMELAQSGTITRFLAKKTGLAGDTEEDYLKADMINEHVQDCINRIIKMRWAPDAESCQKMADEFFEKFLPNWLNGLEKSLKEEGNDWYSANKLTFADLAVQHVLFWLSWPEEKAFKDVSGHDERFNVLDKYPLVKANYERVRNLPDMQEYLKNRPASTPPGL